MILQYHGNCYVNFSCLMFMLYQYCESLQASSPSQTPETSSNIIETILEILKSRQNRQSRFAHLPRILELILKFVSQTRRDDKGEFIAIANQFYLHKNIFLLHSFKWRQHDKGNLRKSASELRPNCDPMLIHFKTVSNSKLVFHSTLNHRSRYSKRLHVRLNFL